MSIFMRMCLGFLVLAGVLIAPGMSRAATHTVAPGEDLATISQSYGISVDSLVDANGLQVLSVTPGQQLTIPEVSNGSQTTYIVKESDNLSMIGRLFGLTYQEIMVANGLNSTVIYPDMELLIPAAGTVAVPGDFSATRSVDVSRGGFFSRPSLEDVDLLARLISSEAEGEPYEGKVAVGAVVLNRVLDPSFPDTIQDVIYQRNQFQPVQNGRINRAACADCLAAAKDALSGWDPTNGALYFFARYVRSAWNWSRPKSTIIGNHVFTY
ncbi:MAG: Spore cortex-lytic enzyme precursor [Pelotomaculum sp. PtaB.Bin104]|nr:MAG: Spore cortex-lytic enzyme precursor [Pelotomaculum sp. PtaB.Bin104]